MTLHPTKARASAHGATRRSSPISPNGHAMGRGTASGPMGEVVDHSFESDGTGGYPGARDLSAQHSSGCLIRAGNDRAAGARIAERGRRSRRCARPQGVRAGLRQVKVGILHPVTGALASRASNAAHGALMAIEDINQTAASSRSAARRSRRCSAMRSRTPQAGAAEIEKMNEAGVLGRSSAPTPRAICLATTQAAAKYNLPHVVDVGVADQIVERGLKNTFRFGPATARRRGRR